MAQKLLFKMSFNLPPTKKYSNLLFTKERRVANVSLKIWFHSKKWPVIFSVTIKWKQVFIKLNFKNIIHPEYWLEIETYCQFNLIFSVSNIFLTNLSLTVVNDAHINFSLLVSVENTDTAVKSKSIKQQRLWCLSQPVTLWPFNHHHHYHHYHHQPPAKYIYCKERESM